MVKPGHEEQNGHDRLVVEYSENLYQVLRRFRPTVVFPRRTGKTKPFRRAEGDLKFDLMYELVQKLRVWIAFYDGDEIHWL